MNAFFYYVVTWCYFLNFVLVPYGESCSVIEVGSDWKRVVIVVSSVVIIL